MPYHHLHLVVLLDIGIHIFVKWQSVHWSRSCAWHPVRRDHWSILQHGRIASDCRKLLE